MTFRDALEAAYPRPAIRRDAGGSTWRCYLDGSLDRVSPAGRCRRVRDVDPATWGDWRPEEDPS